MARAVEICVNNDNASFFVLTSNKEYLDFVIGIECDSILLRNSIRSCESSFLPPETERIFFHARKFF